MSTWFDRLALVLLISACEGPPVFATADKRQNTAAARIEGQVIVSTAARGNVIVSLFDATTAGRAVSFTVVPREQLFGDAVGTGPFTAPFSLSLVMPGRYLVRGFIDADADFVPWYGVTSGVNAGDIAGGAGAPVEVTVDDAGVPRPVLEVTVSFSDASRVPVDRPAFEVNAGSAVTLSRSVDTRLELRSTPLATQRQPVFLAHLVDANGDGVADLGSDGRPLFWPRVVVRKVTDANPLVDETVVLPATFELDALMPRLLDAEGKVKTGPTPVTALMLVLRPPGVDASTGRYAITVIQETTLQTWRVPNELAPGLAEPRGFTAVPSQGLLLQLP